MTDLLFAVPWWIPTLLVIIGVSLFVNGNKRQMANVRLWGIALVLLAIVWSLVSYFVDTDKEKVDRQTHEMVAEVVQGDWTQFQAQLTPAAIFTTSGATLESGADHITAFARSGAEGIKLKSAAVRNLELEQTGTLITARFSIFSQEDALPPYETSGWQFDWEKTSRGWKVRELRLLSIKDVPTDELSRGIRSRR